MSRLDAKKVKLMIYGDTHFRLPSIRHAEIYRNKGAPTWVYNIDTEEQDNGSNQHMNGCAHAAELKEKSRTKTFSNKNSCRMFKITHYEYEIYTKRFVIFDFLQYLFGWGNGNQPWGNDIQDFMITSWRNFIINLDPSSTKYPWEQYDGADGHMEIENDATNGIFRNDKFYDFDNLINLVERY